MMTGLSPSVSSPSEVRDVPRHTGTRRQSRIRFSQVGHRFDVLTSTFRNAPSALTRRRTGVRVPQRPREPAGQHVFSWLFAVQSDREVRVRSVRDRCLPVTPKEKRELRLAGGGCRRFEPATSTQTCRSGRAALAVASGSPLQVRGSAAPKIATMDRPS